MKSLSEFLNESTTDWNDIQWWRNQLSKLFKGIADVGDPVRYGTKLNVEIKSRGVVNMDIVDETTMPDHSNMPRYSYVTTSAGEGKFYLSILDSFDHYKFNKVVFNTIKEYGGLREANGWRCAQWGTWKILIRDKKDAKLLLDILKKCMEQYF